MGVRLPRRVVGGGGLYMEYDGRDVPDVATVVADYDEGCQVLISATMCNDVQLGEVIRGHTATVLIGGSSRTTASASSPRRSTAARPLREPTAAKAASSSQPEQPARRHPRPLESLHRLRPRPRTRRPFARPRWATRPSPR